MCSPLSGDVLKKVSAAHVEGFIVRAAKAHSDEGNSAFAAQGVCVPAGDLANSPQEIPFDGIWMRSSFRFCLLEQSSRLQCDAQMSR